MTESFVDTQSEALFRQECRFLRGVEVGQIFPTFSDLPEVGFIGRSNVGKSSLLNALTHRRGLARTSNTPGRTQQLNFFNLGDRLILVDMPGYGYAQAPKALVQAWKRLVCEYLATRLPLKRVYVLVDSRHGLKPNDEEMMRLLDQFPVSYQVVLTKADKISLSQRDLVYQQTVEALQSHTAAHPEVLMTSAAKRGGLEALRTAIGTFAA